MFGPAAETLRSGRVVDGENGTIIIKLKPKRDARAVYGFNIV